MRLRQAIGLCCPILLVAQVFASDPASAEVPGIREAGMTAGYKEELKQLRQRVQQQQTQIDQLQKSLNDQRELIEKTVQTINAQTIPEGSNQTQSVSSLASGPVALVPAIHITQPYNVSAAAHAAQGENAPRPSPLSIGIGNARLTPGGFLDFTFFSRSTNVGSGLGTTFGSIPFNTSATGRLSESNFTAQNSRLSLKADSKYKGIDVRGYVEADFLGNAPNNLQVTSNPDTFRMRLYWVDLRKGKFEILGGQSWSMMTPNRKGLSPMPEDIFYSLNQDTNYQVGLTWTRQPQFRFIYHPNEKWAAGISLENPQQFVNFRQATANASGTVVLPAALAGNTTIVNQFDNAGATNTATSVPNVIPDVIAKVATDQSVGGKNWHVEAAALVRGFKYTNPLANYRTRDAVGVSGSVNANLEVLKGVHLIANTFFGQGGGRYIFGLGPDLIIRPDGNISPIHSYSTVGGLEYAITKQTMIYSYYGGAYFGRNTAIDSNGQIVGYGGAGSPSGANRSVQEFTFGWNRTFWKNENYGSLGLITQYSYLWRNPWSVDATSPRSARTNMYFINLRYTLP